MGHEIDSATTFIRGIGPNSNGTGEESSVAVYLDDIYIPTGNASIFQLNAISGIDILKGPQGTLFGRNATGGVIQVHTLDPQFDPSADFEGGYGNYNTFTGSAYVTGKVIEDVASNLSVYITDQQSGWGHDVVTGQEAFTAEDWNIRNKWLWTPTSSTRILFAANFAYTRGEVGLGLNQIPQFVAAGGHGYCPGEGGDDGNPQTSPIAFKCPGAPGATYVGWYNTSDNENDATTPLEIDSAPAICSCERPAWYFSRISSRILRMAQCSCRHLDPLRCQNRRGYPLEHFDCGQAPFGHPPAFRSTPKIRSRQIGIGGHANSESSVTLNRNQRSRSTGIRIDGPPP
jgi:hypothetical protein